MTETTPPNQADSTAGDAAGGAGAPAAATTGASDDAGHGPPQWGRGQRGGDGSGGAIRQLRRSRTDRKLAGVCGGLGAYLNVDPIIFRVLFAVFSLFGGFGLLLYGVAWLFIPEDGDDRSEAHHLFRDGRTSAGALWAIAATVVGLLIFIAIAANEWDIVFWLLIGSAITFVLLRSRNPQPSQVGPWWTAQPPPAAGPQAPPSNPADLPGERVTPGETTGSGETAGPATDTASYPAAGGQWAARAAQPDTWPSQQQWQPQPQPPPAPTPRESSPVPWLTLSVALVVGGILGALDLADVIDVSAETIAATILIIFGVGLVVSAWFGRARSLIGLGIAALVALVLIAAVDIPLSGGFGERHVEPVSAGEFGDPVRLAAGKITIDLTRFSDRAATSVLDASVGAGEIVVIYPNDIRLEATADVSAGDVNTELAQGTRVNDDRVVHDPVGASKGTVRLNLDVGAGNIRFEEASRAPS